jgi:CheY-like chemotaxis protein
MADSREASLIGRIADIVHAKYQQNDFYGPDVTALDVPALHCAAQPLIKQSRNPRVFLVMKNRWMLAGCAVMLKNVGCNVTVCSNGREAYVNFLRRRSHRFDLAVVEWDLPDVNGKDLVTYCRSEGSTLCFVALLSATVLPGMAIRGGANLFLRMPLAIHLHVIRKLLLPAEVTATGFPTHILKSKARYNELSAILGSPASTSKDEQMEQLVNEVSEQLRDDAAAEDASQVEQIVDNLRRLLAKAAGRITTASDRQIERLQDVVLRLLRIAKDCRVGLYRSQEELRRARFESAYSAIGPLPNEPVEGLSKNELRTRIGRLERQCYVKAQEGRTMEEELQTLATMNLRLEETLGLLRQEDLAGSGSARASLAFADIGRQATEVAPLVSLVPPPLTSPPALMSPRTARKDGAATSPRGDKRFMSLKDLKSLSTRGAPRRGEAVPRTPQQVAESLEKMLMEQEDLHSAAQKFRPDPVVLPTPWDSSKAVELQQVYNLAATVVTNAVCAINKLCARMVATYPKMRPRLVEFATDFHRVFAAAPVTQIFSRQNVPDMMLKVCANVPTAAELARSSHLQKAAVESQNKLHAVERKLVSGLNHQTNQSQLRRAFFAWQLFRFARRGFVFDVTDENNMRRLRANKELNETKAALQQTRVQAQQLQSALEFANATIANMKAELNASWEPPPIPQLFAQKHAETQTDDALLRSTSMSFETTRGARGANDRRYDSLTTASRAASFQRKSMEAASPRIPRSQNEPVATVAPSATAAAVTVTMSQHAELRVAEPGGSKPARQAEKVPSNKRTTKPLKRSKKAAERTVEAEASATNVDEFNTPVPPVTTADSKARPDVTSEKTGVILSSDAVVDASSGPAAVDVHAKVSPASVRAKFSMGSTKPSALAELLAEKEIKITELRARIEELERALIAMQGNAADSDHPQDTLQDQENTSGAPADGLRPTSGRASSEDAGEGGSQSSASANVASNSSSHAPEGQHGSDSIERADIHRLTAQPDGESNASADAKAPGDSQPLDNHDEIVPTPPARSPPSLPVIEPDDDSGGPDSTPPSDRTPGRSHHNTGPVVKTAECTLELRATVTDNPFLARRPPSPPQEVEPLRPDAWSHQRFGLDQRVAATPGADHTVALPPSSLPDTGAAKWSVPHHGGTLLSPRSPMPPHGKPDSVRPTSELPLLAGARLGPQSTLISGLSVTPRTSAKGEGATSPNPRRGGLPVLDSRHPVVVDQRKHLHDLLMAQTAKAPAIGSSTSLPPIASAVPSLARVEVTPKSARKSEDSRKLFEKLGIGKMPKTNPKPSSFGDDFAVSARR